MAKKKLLPKNIFAPFKKFAGFSMVGLVVTFFSIGLLFILINILNVSVYFAYTFSYLLSITISYLLNGKLIFKGELNIKSFSLYNVVYLSGMLIGLLLIFLIEQMLDFDDFVSSLSVIPFTMLWNFLLIRQVFARH
jgi:putative flippase GtrA